MDQETREKLIKFEGLDFCAHGKQRMYCPKCMWDVPPIYKEKRENFLKKRIRIEPIKPERDLSLPLIEG